MKDLYWAWALSVPLGGGLGLLKWYLDIPDYFAIPAYMLMGAAIMIGCKMMFKKATKNKHESR